MQWIVHERGYMLENIGRSLLQARHLLLPALFLLRAIQQVGQIINIILRCLAVLMLLIHRLEFRFEIENRFLATLDALHQGVEFRDKLLLVRKSLCRQLELFER